MRQFGILVGLLAIACLGWGCGVDWKCLDARGSGCSEAVEGEGGDGGAGGEGGPDGSEGGTGGYRPERGGKAAWREDQYVDAEGICRSHIDPQSVARRHGCALTFDEQLETTSPCDIRCAGTCGDWLVVHETCLPSVGCTYDPDSRALVGITYFDDVPVHCGESAFTVIYGDGYHGCRFTDQVVADGCWH